MVLQTDVGRIGIIHRKHGVKLIPNTGFVEMSHSKTCVKRYFEPYMPLHHGLVNNL